MVTVLLPVYNGEEYLKSAIDSILTQTYTDFEFLIINDGSTDTTENIILSYTDPRIRYVKNEQNIKLIATLNKGLKLAKGKYIARMDADDISLPERLEKQISFLENNPNVGLCGSYLKSLGTANNQLIGYKTNSDEIKFRLLFDTHFPHPAAVLRKDILDQFGLEYEAEYIHVEDYVLWNRMAEHTDLAILPEVLVLKREHENQISLVHYQTQQKIMGDFRKALTEKITGPIDVNTYAVYSALLKAEYPTNSADVIAVLKLIETLVENNKRLKIYNPQIMDDHFTNVVFSMIFNASGMGLKILNEYKKTSLAKNLVTFNLTLKYILGITPKYMHSVQTI
jgi:glycosyltransferase involved in cell wall biosynthesis